ncbi:MAG: gliding motility-associated C-terminal domain-containing protein [Saprospirales bacterium]|nr:gliding motility-associated C-terminal domain-containing protein [Saprospirales bacterium]
MCGDQPFLSGNASGNSPDLAFGWTTSTGNILSGGASLTPVINAPGEYALTVEDQDNGCVSAEPVLVGQNMIPPVLVIANPGLLTCVQEQVVLNAAGSDNSAIFGLVWTTGNGNILSGGQTITPLVNAPGTYTLTILNTVNGCTSASAVQVLQDIVPPVVGAGPDFTLPCTEDVGYLQGSVSAATNNLLIDWQTADGQLESGSNTLTPGISTGGTYQLTVTNLVNGCLAADDVFVAVNFPANPDFVSVQPLCFGDNGQIEILGVTGGTPPYLYSVNGGFTFQSSPLFTNLAPDLYTVLIQDALGCETDPEEQPIIAPEPVVVDAEATIELLQGDTYQLEAQVNLAESEIQLITWTPPLGLSCTDCLDPLVTALQTLLYHVEIVSQDGCTAAAAVQVFVDERPLIYVPNVFSPNGDGENDVFYIFARDKNVKEIRSFLVFNRWGESVFEYYHFQPNNPAFGWDGNHRGQPVNPAVFAWFAEVEFIDGRVELFKGDVSLVR